MSEKEEMSEIKEFIWQIAVKKMVGRAIQLIVAYLMANNIEAIGIKLDENALTLSAYSAIELLRNYLKVKYRITWL